VVHFITKYRPKSESFGEILLKIGQHLRKLWTRVHCIEAAFWLTVHIISLLLYTCK